MIKAIQTEYNGYRFRSRLEARWAVFFDELGIEYEYEPEGFELSSGCYLPDFFLRDFQIFVEIKPSVPEHIPEWKEKCGRFRRETGHAILLCCGDPSEDVWKYLFAWDTCDSGGGECDSGAVFAVYGCKAFIVTEDQRNDRTIYIDDSWNTNSQVMTVAQFFNLRRTEFFNAFVQMIMLDVFNPHANDSLNLAKKKARQARFEFGESPRPR